MKLYKHTKSIFSKYPKFFMMLLSLCCATGMWWLISNKDRIEATMELYLDFSNIPENLIVTDGLTNKVSVRLRGPERLLRTIPRETFRKNIDLSNIKKGENIVSVGERVKVPEFRAFDVISFDPPTITVHADKLLKKEVRVNVDIESPLGDGTLEYIRNDIRPPSVVIEGPEKIVQGIKSLSYTIQGDANANEGSQIIYPLVLKTPPLVTPIKENKVDVYYTVTSRRAEVTVNCPIIVAGANADEYETDPKEISVRVNVPAALKNNKEYLKKAIATVMPPDMMSGENRRVPIKLEFPDGMTKAAAADREVTLTRLEKNWIHKNN